MASLRKDLVFLMMQFCKEAKLEKTAHMLEQETGYFFDIKYFEDLVLGGNWDEAEKYLSGFTSVEDNKDSIQIHCEIRKQKFLEALDRNDRAMALNIMKDLQVLAPSNEGLYKEMSRVLTLDDFRKYGSVSLYGDTMAARELLMSSLKVLIYGDPKLHGRLEFPQIEKSRLLRLINQSLNWQHFQCVHPKDVPSVETLFTDHKCLEPEQSFSKQDFVIANNNSTNILANDCGQQLLGTCDPYLSDSSGILSESLSKLHLNSSLPRARIIGGGALPGGAEGYSKDVKPAVPAEPHYISGTQRSCKVFEVARCQSMKLPSKVKTNKIAKLMYTSTGNGLLALGANGVHLYWKWVKDESLSTDEDITKYSPQQFQPKSGLLMINDVVQSNFVSPCLALSKNDSYVISASGGMISLYNLLTFKNLRSCMPGPPVATCIAFYPADNNIIAIGFDDSTILIYNIRVDEVISRLKGHSERISGLAFSSILNILVSSAVDAQIIVWDTLKWEQKCSTVLQISSGWLPSELSETHVQLHQDQKQLLAVHETQLAIYDLSEFKHAKQWVIGDFCARICHASFSCDCQLLYAVLRDGIVLILSASDLYPRLEINPLTYLPSEIRPHVYPVVVAAHPKEANRFALGLSDGEVIVVEPPESEGKWNLHPTVKKTEHPRIKFRPSL